PMRNALLTTAALVFLFGVSRAAADTITFTAQGVINSATVAPEDPVLVNPAFDANASDPWNLTLTYAQGDFAHAALALSLDDTANGGSDYALNFSAPADVLAFTSPGPDGAGTNFFQLCIGGDCSNFLNLYFRGAITGPDDASGLNLLTEDALASPEPFEFQLNFPATGDQTDLLGSITSTSATLAGSPPPIPVPEPAGLWLLATGLLVLALRRPLACASPR
ncbi:MAG: PEP-CTERM sorting domain-containing protein, partial [Terriglobales bacterium]